MTHLRLALIFLIVIAGLFACLASFKSNGATDHPLYVKASGVVCVPVIPGKVRRYKGVTYA